MHTAALPRSTTAPLALALTLATLVLPTSTPDRTTVIVRAAVGRLGDAVELVTRAGGSVGRHIGLIDGFTAAVRTQAIRHLTPSPAITSVTPDRRVVFNGLLDPILADPNDGGTSVPPTSDPATDPGSMYTLAKSVLGLNDLWSKGFTGKGIDIALIDTGVVPVNGLTYTGKVINGADLSFESQFPEARYMDTFGHGTHMAGIIAGRDDAAKTIAPSTTRFLGIAPGARLLNVKVADHAGRTDLSQVLAAMDWVVANRKSNKMNVRVLTLAFGTDSLQPYATDPLTYAVEKAWQAGIVVVVAAGNSNFGDDSLNNPAYDPFVIAVGAAQTNGTATTADDYVPNWSASGNLARNPDLVAPGRSLSSLRSPGSSIDEGYPQARIGTRFFRGSGTSQAAAVTAGVAALLLQQRPTMNPDQVKRLLTSTARTIPGEGSREQGAGLIQPEAARAATTPSALLSKQLHAPATGLGTLELGRGSIHVSEGGTALVGEKDIFGAAWRPERLTGSILPGEFWWDGDWTGTSWAGRSWSGRSWSGTDWSGRSWSGRSWSGRSWSNGSWSGRSWSSTDWSGRSWSSDTWSSAGWS